MRPVVCFGSGLLVGAVTATKVLESRGVLHCGCPDQCWCHRPVLTALRWVVPVRHRSPEADHGAPC